MPPAIYPDLTWSGQFGRFIRTLQIVGIAGAIGAVAGGTAVFALVRPASNLAHHHIFLVTDKAAEVPQPSPIVSTPSPPTPSVPAAAELAASTPAQPTPSAHLEAMWPVQRPPAAVKRVPPPVPAPANPSAAPVPPSLGAALDAAQNSGPGKNRLYDRVDSTTSDRSATNGAALPRAAARSKRKDPRITNAPSGGMPVTILPQSTAGLFGASYGRDSWRSRDNW